MLEIIVFLDNIITTKAKTLNVPLSTFSFAPSLVLVSVLSVAILRRSVTRSCAALWRPCRKYVPEMSFLIASFKGNETHPRNSLRLKQ